MGKEGRGEIRTSVIGSTIKIKLKKIGILLPGIPKIFN